MKLTDVSYGPDWIVWVVFFILTIMSITLLLGHGSWLIAEYNTASKEEKAKYNEKKLCRVMGIGMTIITLLILIAELFEKVLPSNFTVVMIIIIIIDVTAIEIASKEKAKYNEKKLCRVMGIGMTIITLLILIAELFEKVLPSNFTVVMIIIIIIDVTAIEIASNTICKR